MELSQSKLASMLETDMFLLAGDKFCEAGMYMESSA